MTAASQTQSVFEGQWCRVRPRLLAHLSRRGVSPEDQEDLLQGAALRIWSRHSEVHFLTDQHLIAYAKVVLRNLIVDAASVATDSLEQDLLQEHRFDESCAIATELIRITNDLWLGLPSAYHDHALVLGLALWDGHSMETVDRLRRAMNIPLPLEVLWDCPRLVRELAFRKLSLSPESVAEHALGWKGQVLLLARQSAATRVGYDGYSVRELEVLLAKFADYEASSRIALRLGLCQSEVAEIVGSRWEQMPFLEWVRQMRHMWPHPDSMGAALRHDGFWKRLLLHYALDEMPHADMIECLGPLAQECGYPLTPMRLHSWLSKKRIYAEIRTQADRLGGLNGL